MKQTLFFAQKAFVVRNDQLLVVQKSNDDPDQAGYWEVPGGRMAFGEDVDEQLRREVREEVGIDVEVGAPFYVWQWMIKRPEASGEIHHMQIVAVARLCSTKQTELSDAHRVAEDYLGDARWARLAELDDYSFIPNMYAVVSAFRNLVGRHME